MKDLCHGDTPLTDAASLAHWNKLIRAFLAHGTATPTHLTALLTAHPEFSMGHALKGLFCLLLGRREMVATAREALVAARRGDLGGPRCSAMVWALDAWLAGKPSGAVMVLEKVLDTNPADTLFLKLSQAIRFVLGDAQGMRWSVEQSLGAHDESHPFRGFALGCHAFTLEETGEYLAAEKAGLLGLSHAPDDAWGLHAVAHVHDMTGQSRRGIAVIEDHSATWLACNNFRYHVWWHKALLHLDLGETDQVLALYDTRIRADRTDDYRDISNAASLLMRLSLDGVAVGDRWEELADLAETRIEDACLAFADLHYMLALVGGNRAQAVTKLLARVSAAAAVPSANEADAILAAPGAAATAGLAAFAEGNFADAFANLTKARPLMQSIGGSHAQRDVFARLTIDAGIRAGQFAQAEALILGRKALRGGVDDRFSAHRKEAIAAARREGYLVAAQ